MIDWTFGGHNLKSITTSDNLSLDLLFFNISNFRKNLEFFEKPKNLLNIEY